MQMKLSVTLFVYLWVYVLLLLLLLSLFLYLSLERLYNQRLQSKIDFSNLYFSLQVLIQISLGIFFFIWLIPFLWFFEIHIIRFVAFLNHSAGLILSFYSWCWLHLFLKLWFYFLSNYLLAHMEAFSNTSNLLFNLSNYLIDS